MIDRLRELASKFCSRRCDYASVRIGWIPSRRGFEFSRVAALVQQPSQDSIRIALARTAFDSKLLECRIDSRGGKISMNRFNDFWLPRCNQINGRCTLEFLKFQIIVAQCGHRSTLVG